MLRELHISNLAVIADARIELTGGLNCFTGSTGAGKSLVIGALQVLLGLKNPGEMLRPGADEGRVSGVFDVPAIGVLRQIEALSDVKVSEDGGELLITRRLYASGRSSVSLNGSPITLGMLRTVSELLVDVHGQHDHQYLLKPANQVDVLDQFAGLWPLREQYHAVHSQLHAARKKLHELSASRTLREQQLELYRFQADEIDAAALDPAEQAELEARSLVLRNLQKLKKDAGAVQGGLYEADGAVLERLKMMAAVLSELALLDANLNPIAAGVRDATMALEEASFDLSRYLGKLDLDPSELVEIDDRLNIINRILSKYGRTMADTLAFRADLADRIAQIGRATDDLSALHKQIAPLAARLKELGVDLSGQRRAAAGELAPRIERELAQLGMDKAKFTIELSLVSGNEDSATASGFDQVEFIAQTNPGQLAQPLRKIASGGEMSRIMLALKGILAQSDRVSVLVFDEIDANVGGRLGSIIGGKLRALSLHHQVLCITHLPQIASYADRHLTVRKEVIDNQTRTTVRIMDGAERIEELSEMIGGQRITPTTRAQAAELLENAQLEFSPAKSATPSDPSSSKAKSTAPPSPPSAPSSTPPPKSARGVRAAKARS